MPQKELRLKPHVPYLLLGPLSPIPGFFRVMIPGFTLRSSFSPKPRRSKTRGLKFSSTASDLAASSFINWTPMGFLRLTVNERTPMLHSMKRGAASTFLPLAKWRKLSNPPWSDSTLMTSAPNCARSRPAKGPAYPVVKLMIRTPSRILLVLNTGKPSTQCKMQSANLKIKNDFAFCLLQFAFALDHSFRCQDLNILLAQPQLATIDLTVVLTQKRRRRRLGALPRCGD